MARRQTGLLRWYPAAWRERYGEEFLAFLEDRYGTGPLPLPAWWSLLAGGLRERARHAGLIGDRVPVTERVRAGVLVVLAAWTGFVVAAFSFAKFSEDFRSASPRVTLSGRGVSSVFIHPPDPGIASAAFTLLEVVLGLAAVAVVGGAALAVPAFWRFLRAGGWPSIRGHVVRASVATMALVITTMPLLTWAHHLTWPQRNGQLAVYGAVVLGWGGLIALCLALWTAAAIAAARRMDIPWVVLFFQAMVAVGVAASMVVMLLLTSVWWASVAVNAPWVLRLPQNTLGGAVPYMGGSGGAWNLWLASIVGLMAVSTAGAVMGAARIAGVWSTSRRAA
jgi:hypothetical protein